MTPTSVSGREGVLALAAALRRGERSSRELVEAALASAAADELGAWARTYPERALAQAATADACLAMATKGGPEPPLLCGIPLGVKDTIAVAGLPLTLGRESGRDERPATDATVWRRLRGAGAVLIGHNRTQELALGEAPQLARNPWRLSHSPGGSSNGGAVAVAVGTVPAAIGTDVGGSLRRPASACGLTTVVTGAGAVPLDGVFSFDRGIDHVGPLAADAADCAAILKVLDGAVGRPPGAPRDTGAGARAGGLAGTRIARARAEAWPVAAAVEAVAGRFAAELREQGAEVLEVESPPLPPRQTAPRPEQVSFFRRHPPGEEGGFGPWAAEFGREVLRRAERGCLADDQAAARGREGAQRAWRRLFDRHRLDAVLVPAQLVPTPPLPAPGAGGDIGNFGAASVRSLWNQLGMPVVCLPAGTAPGGGMPLGMQLVASPGGDFRLLEIAHTYQRETGYHLVSPLSP